jgi:tetratricopeptide (TPR) repeat protein
MKSRQSSPELWAKSFERELGDVLALQNEIARAVAERIETSVTADEKSRLTASRPVEAKAYEANLLGRFLLDQGTEESLNKARDQFTKALEIQNDYAAAYAGLASYYAILPFYTSLSPAEVFPKARANAEKSLKLDERLAEAHFVLVHTALGEKDLAFEWLERAYQERSTVLAYLRLDPRLAPLRSDPRFAGLLARLGIGA